MISPVTTLCDSRPFAPGFSLAGKPRRRTVGRRSRGAATQAIGVGRADLAAPPPSKPDRRFSRLRLSSRWVLCREGAALRLVPKDATQTFGITRAHCTRLIPPLASPRGHARWFSLPSVCRPHFHLPAFPARHGRYPLRSYYGRSDSRQPGGWTLGPDHPPALAELPGCLGGASGHSVSNPQRVVRGPPGCPALRFLT